MDEWILESMSIPLLVVGEDGLVQRVNGAAGHFWRQGAARLRGYEVTRLFGGDDRVVTAVKRAVREEASSTISPLRIEERPGLPPLTLSVQVDPLMAPEQPVSLALVSFWDETTRFQMESETRAAERLDSIGLLARRLAHELQNPLSGIKGAFQLLGRKLGGTVESTDYFKVILREMERMERLIKDLLVYGDDPPLNPNPFNLHELLDEVLWFVSNSESSVSLERDYDPSLPDLAADRDRMQQVFLNLVRNAVEAGPEGGTIRIRTGMTGPWGEPGPVSEAAGIYFRIEVEDDGPGVLEKDIERLFTPFFTTRKNGTGLGLSISYQIVRAHGGALRYRFGNRPGDRNGQTADESHGAVFSVYLPMNRP